MEVQTVEVQRGSGIVKNWFGSYGFIQTNKDEFGIYKELFFHVSAIRSGVPVIGWRATFTVGESKKGPVAVAVILEPKIVAGKTPDPTLAGGN